ncbi:MAG: hypothetical protein R3A12_13600 [Ignavibacteria bacterium]
MGFIGYLNAPPGEVSEEVHPYNNAWIESVSSMNRTFKRMDGTVSYLIGPANTWKSFHGVIILCRDRILSLMFTE